MRWFKQLFSRRRRYDELHESIQEHLKEKTEDLMEDGMSGKSPSKLRGVSLEMWPSWKSAAAKFGSGHGVNHSWQI